MKSFRQGCFSCRVSWAFLLLWCALVSACAPQRPMVPSVLLRLEGPPLYMVGDMDGHIFSGRMERGCLAGVGGFTLSNQTLGLLCEGLMDAPANEKGRLYAISQCRDGSRIEFAFRNLGPDQGLGVGHLYKDEDAASTTRLITVVYHSCEDEAKRRLHGVLADIEKALRSNAEENSTPGNKR